MNEATPIRRRQTVRLNEISDKRMNDQKLQGQYQPYKDAAWGFINHWYPALFSEELPEEGVEGIQICGIPIVLRRVDGKIYALKDQCVHRGVRLSAKPMCLTKKSISCWYHGFTFDLESGRLTTIIANPGDKLIGNTGITTYPVEEKGGMIFVFVREDDFPDEDVPPLASDLPVRFPDSSERFPHPLWPASPSILDEDAVALGIHRTGETTAQSRPSRARGLKHWLITDYVHGNRESRPSRARGLKRLTQHSPGSTRIVAPFTGAWIETEESQ